MSSLIPAHCPPEHQSKPGHFTRRRKLPFAKTLTLLYHLVGQGRREGVDIELGRFYKNAARSGLWAPVPPATRGAFSKRRQRIPTAVLPEIHGRAVTLVQDLWPDSNAYTWRGHTVCAFDGVKLTLPATAEIRQAFDPASGLQYPGKGHYPQCLATTLYDVFRRLPLARRVTPVTGSERECARQLLAQVPPGVILLYDRGFSGYQFLHAHLIDHPTLFVMRGPASGTFGAVERFIQSGREEEIIAIAPTTAARQSLEVPAGQELPTLSVRAIRLEHPQDGPSVLLTNLMDPHRYPASAIRALYFRRWDIETYFREEQVVLDVETFHSRTVNGVLQELYAVMTVTLIARLLAAFAERLYDLPPRRVQAKNAVLAWAEEAALLSPDRPAKARTVLEALLEELRRVLYYLPTQARPPQPRVCKRSHNKWMEKRAARLPPNSTPPAPPGGSP